MKRSEWERAVRDCLHGRPELLPVWHDALGIVDHVRDYNPDLFVVLNVGRNMAKAMGLPREEWPPLPPDVIPVWGAWWEIHSLTERPSYVLTVTHGALDGRVLADLYRGDIAKHGPNLFKEMEARNERLKASRARAHGNELEALAQDTRNLWAQVDGPKVQYGPGAPSTGHVFAPKKELLVSTPSGVTTTGR